MACSCLKNNYNINVYHRGDAVIYEDQSLWMEEEGYTIPDTYDVNLYYPETSEPTLLSLRVKEQNILELENIVDGIYCFETMSCTILYKSFKALLPEAEKKLRELKSKLTPTSPQKDWDVVWKLEGYLEMINSSVALEQFDNANKAIDLLQDELSNYNCCM